MFRTVISSTRAGPSQTFCRAGFVMSCARTAALKNCVN